MEAQTTYNSARQRKVLFVTSLAVFMGFLDVTIVTMAFPDIQRTFSDTSITDLSWVLNAYNIVFAALLIPAGRLADLVGRKRMFMYGLFIFVLASAVCGAAPSALFLIVARLVQAVGAAIIVPTSLALVLPEFPPAKRAMAVGLWGIGAALAAAAGPPLGGVLVDGLDWRFVFLVNLPVGATVYLMGRRTLHESRDQAEGARPDLVGIALLALSVGLVALGILKGEQWGWASARIISVFAISAVAAAMFVVRCANHRAPVIEFALLRSRSFAAANAGTLLFASAFYAMLLGNVLFLTDVWHYSTLEAGVALTPTPVITAALAGPAGLISDRYGQRVVTVPGALLFGATALWFAYAVGTSPDYVGEWLPGMVMAGVAIGLAFPALASAAVAAMPQARFGAGSAFNAAARELGAVAGVTFFVAILGSPAVTDVPVAFQRGYLAIAIASFASFIACLALGRVRALYEQKGALEASAT